MNELADLFKRNYKEYVKYAAALVGNDDAEDVLQRLFIKLYTNNYDIEMIGNIIFLIIKRECYSYNDHIRRKRRKIRTFGSYTTLSKISDDIVVNAVLENEFNNHAMHLFKILSPKRKKCMQLFYLDGFNCSEIAKLVNCSHATVRDHLFHARIKLREINIKF